MNTGRSSRPTRSGTAAVLVVAVVTAVLPVLLVDDFAGADSSVAADAEPVTWHGSRTVGLDRDWRFALVNAEDITDPTGEYEDAYQPGFDDSGWRRLDVPHDWSIELEPTTDPGSDPGTGFFQGGLGWYRKTFTLPPTMKDERISVEFDGVYMDSYVYFNGELVGNHPYGYTGFSFDLTDLAHTDGKTPNVLAVKVQNKVPSSRWYSGSGIYRHVRLVVTDPVHVKRWGTFVTTPNLESTLQSGYANVRVQTDVVNEGGGSVPVEIQSRVRDASGRVVGQARSTVTVGADPYRDIVDIRVDDPRLWSTDDPYGYTLETKLAVDEEVVDTYTTRFGVRYVEIDPDDGLLLNGEYVKIQGVDLHHDLGALGAAVNRDAILRQMTIMKSMGVNALRTAHNPPSPEMVDVCEQLGIMMMVEAFDTWSRPKTAFDYARFFNEHSDADIKEMVNAAKNSPAVIMWSIGNEIRGQTVADAQRLIDDIKSIDTTRPVVWGHDGYRSVPGDGSTNDRIARLLDGVGLNYNTAKSVDALHQKYPDKFWFESESSSSTSTRGYYQDAHQLNTGENYTPGRMAASSYDNNMASWTMPGEYGLKKDRDRKFFTGEFLWSGFDYIGEPTPFFNNFPVKSSHFGAVDTAGFPKDLYYLFKSQWTTEPMVHLLPMNWTDYEPGEPVEVWAYSNVDTVELFLNGESLGVRSFDHKTTTYGKDYLETTEQPGDDKTFTSGPCPGSYTSPNGSCGKLHLSWTVPFEPGRLVAVAKRDGAEVARDEVRTAGRSASLRLTPDRRVIRSDGTSLSYLTVDVVDEDGVVVPSADNRIDFDVSGGTLVGVDNGRQESAERYKADHRDAFNGKALAIVQSTRKAGPITVTARSSGLAPARTTIHAVDSPGGRGLVGIDPVYLRTGVGPTPELPAMIRGVRGDGSSQSLSVRWSDVPADLGRRAGVYRIEGDVAGTGEPAMAVVTVYRVADVAGYSVVVPVGTPPDLPDTVRVTYTDGVSRIVPVDWAPADESRYAAPGQFTVNGMVTGGLTARATVQVTDDVLRDQNIALSTSPTGPSADASYSGSADSIPAGMLDGDTTSGGWSNAYSKDATALLPAYNQARRADWVSVRWPDPQRFDSMTAYFTTDSTHALPASIEVSYRDGGGFVPVDNLDVTWASSSNEPTTITFDPVSTEEVRLAMTSSHPDSPAGHLQITELEITGDVVAVD